MTKFVLSLKVCKGSRKKKLYKIFIVECELTFFGNGKKLIIRIIEVLKSEF